MYIFFLLLLELLLRGWGVVSSVWVIHCGQVEAGRRFTVEKYTPVHTDCSQGLTFNAVWSPGMTFSSGRKGRSGLG